MKRNRNLREAREQVSQAIGCLEAAHMAVAGLPQAKRLPLEAIEKLEECLAMIENAIGNEDMDPAAAGIKAAREDEQ